MLIVIPTYRRTDSLKWVLESLVKCRTRGIGEPIRVLVVNNHPAAKNSVAAVVSEYSRHSRFDWEILAR